jgi:hypothetical protein
MVVIISWTETSQPRKPDYLYCQLSNLDKFSPVLRRPILVQIQFRSLMKELKPKSEPLKWQYTSAIQMVAEGTLQCDRNWSTLSLEVVTKSPQTNPLRCRNYANGPIQMVADEPHERHWLIYVCAV